VPAAEPVFPVRWNARFPLLVIEVEDQRMETLMTDFRNLDSDPLDPNDPYRRDPKLDPNLRPANAFTGWIVAAVFAVAILAVIFGLARQPGQLGTNTASNDVTPPPVTHMALPAPPSGEASPQMTPQAPPISPTPAPAQSGDQ
jgi:hypothetical protein